MIQTSLVSESSVSEVHALGESNQYLDFCSEAMLEGWKKDTENFQTADQQFEAYMQFYNKCFEVCLFPRLTNDSRYEVDFIDCSLAASGHASGNPSMSW